MNLVKLLALTLLTTGTLAQAQEQHGHGKTFFGIFEKKQQQQQQQRQKEFQLKVIEGKAAEDTFYDFASRAAVKNLEDTCSEPVLRVKVGSRASRVQECFDRGEDFSRGTRYKCYVLSNRPAFDFQRFIFWNTHNACGGDGIYPLNP